MQFKRTSLENDHQETGENFTSVSENDAKARLSGEFALLKQLLFDQLLTTCREAPPRLKPSDNKSLIHTFSQVARCVRLTGCRSEH